ncbi:CREB-binding protein-like [Pseudomyrmex gracilis]|uniref:CREB-binding protein-like n=1 Tax=Pseudomyrmex gracilis TaxID=219809 RepID=UPI000994BEDB|nr:CREB-binding protein-like [Pseudomyrmex gracilis]
MEMEDRIRRIQDWLEEIIERKREEIQKREEKEKNPEERLIGIENRLANLQLSSGLQLSQVTAAPVKRPQGWHQSVTPDLRNHLVQKLAQTFSMFHAPNPQPILDKIMCNLVAYAREMECVMFEMATTRSEYYQLLAECIYKIQNVLEEKSQKREEQKLLAQQQL